MRLVKKVPLIFALSFLFNLVWENLHSVLYTTYQGGAITEWILIRATLADALMITASSILFIYVPFLRRNMWLAILLGFAVAIGIETWALESGRWTYSTLMPIIPILGTGLTPTIQLGILGYAVLRVVCVSARA